MRGVGDERIAFVAGCVVDPTATVFSPWEAREERFRLIRAKWAGVPHWHPNQLRHLFATEVRRVHSLEAAQVLLGHSQADVTQVYAERDFALAAGVAAKIG